MKRIIVVAPHPDDETLGCGGTLLNHKAKGDEIYWLIVTNVDEKNGWSKERVESRRKEINVVSEMYGFTKTFKLNFPTTKLDTIPMGAIIDKISKVFNEVKPEIIYLPNRSDVHSDHGIVFQSAYSCTKNFRYPFIKKILMYETLSETEFAASIPENSFIPNYFVDISNQYDKKIEIMKIFDSEIMADNLPRSLSAIEAHSKYRGSRIGVKNAECFCLIFCLEKFDI